MSFSQTCLLHGDRPETRLLSAELVPVTEKVREKLALPADETLVLKIRRLRFCNDEPVVVEENYFPRNKAFLLGEDLTQSLFGILEAHGVRGVRGDKTISVCAADHEEARLLQVPEGEAMLLTHDTVYDTDGRPVFTGREVINPRRFEYRLRQSEGG